MEENHRKYKATRTEVIQLNAGNERKQTWGEFGHKMKENYLENQKLFYNRNN
jgi:hypothetical protein